MEELLGVKFGRSHIPGVTAKEKNIIYVQDCLDGDLFDILDESIKITHAKDGAMIEEACRIKMPDGSIFHAFRCAGDYKGWFKDIKSCAQTLGLLTATIQCNNMLKNAFVGLINFMPDNIGTKLISYVTTNITDYTFVLSNGISFKLSECKVADDMAHGMTPIRMRDVTRSAKQERKQQILVHLEHLEMAANDMLTGLDKEFVLEALLKYRSLFTKIHKKGQYFEDIIRKVLKKHKAKETKNIKDYIDTATEIMMCAKIIHTADIEPSSVTVIYERSSNSNKTN